MEFQNSQLFKLLDYPRGDIERGRFLFERLIREGVTDISFVSKGYRGVVFKGKLGEVPVAVKVPRSDSGKDFVEKECEVLNLLQGRLGSKNPAPKVYKCGEDFLVMEWIEGIPFERALREFGSKVILKALESVYLLDRAEVEHSEIKGEKHLLFDGERFRIIDFESSKLKERPRNLLQFVGYHLLRKKELLESLGVDRERLLRLLELYKEEPERAFGELCSLFDK